ncbi:Lysine-specific demethylase 5B [Dissostichus eleginoides]|uniref:Lysine-specific demethylase 5B n=1 Tax=Dissostichus eleginoides TaxID=100907 RepID=A0AAD9FJN8_DISEL|nr:Lysine-specific demethylase 5B [Dissostichus eleginoides]
MLLGQVSLRLDEVRGDSEGEVGSACFGQVSRRLGRLLKRLPKSRSWSDSLRILRRSSSNGSLLTTSAICIIVQLCLEALSF